MKQNIMIRKLALWLAVLLTAGPVLTGCGERQDTASETTGQTAGDVVAAEAQEPEEEDARASVPDNLPERDFGGYGFTILTYSPGTYYVEEMNGDVVEDAKYERNFRLAERFNAEIGVVASPGINELDAALKASVISGDNAYDIAIPHQITSGPGFITGHCIADWKNVPYVNPEQPWWNQSINETISIKGTQFYLAGYITMPTPFCMFINRAFITDYGFDDIYATVKEGKWVFDRMTSMTRAVVRDLDGDGQMTENDQYGISFNNDNNTLNFMYASGIQSVVLDAEGMPVPNVFNDKMISLVEKMYDLIYNDNQTLFTTYSTQAELGTGGFTAGRIMIKCGGVGDLASLRESEIELGVIPYPMWEEGQDGYHTHVDAWNGMLCIPITASEEDLERTGIVVEAMAAETWKTVIPAYYEVALGTKYVRDEESAEMLDIIFDGIVYDFGYIFDNWKGCTWTLPNMMVQGKTDVASYWKGVEKIVNKHYKKLYEAIGD
jgi:hypothetical protein